MNKENDKEYSLIKKALFSTDSSVDSEKLKILFEEYKLYVDTMEKLVARRQTTNSFFLTANAFLMTVAGFFVKNVESPISLASGGAIVIVAIAGILLSLNWRTLSIHYGLMNRAKFEIIHTLERQLPAALFWAEWVALGEGKDPRKYQSMSKIEATIPKILIICYIALALFAVLLMVNK